jgi:hypothetical protein
MIFVSSQLPSSSLVILLFHKGKLVSKYKQLEMLGESSIKGSEEDNS